MKYYIIAGEASGDLHGSNLINALQLEDTHAEIRCWGGDKMREAGAVLVKHYRDLAFMGFTEVLMNLKTILNNLSFCKKDILAYSPDVLILVDYPGFNLRIAEWAHEQGIKVIYYISPQVWAWKENRVKIIKRCVDKMLVILPFEKAFYQQWDYPVDYVGHPLLEVIDRFKKENSTTALHFTGGKKIIALLPGSRKQEILKKLPVMLEVSRQFQDYQFVVAKAPGLDASFYDQLLSPYPHVQSVVNQTYELLSVSAAALVTSGTATLETALFGVPEIICYKGNPVSYRIAKMLVNIKYIGLVNLIMDKEVMKELIQHDLTVENLSAELKKILEDKTRQQEMAKDYERLREILGQGGNASVNAAKIISRFLNPSSL